MKTSADSMSLQSEMWSILDEEGNMNYRTIALDLRAERDRLQDRVSELEETKERCDDKIADLEADLHAMRAARDSLISWIKVIMESEYTLSAIQASGRIAIKESIAEAERPAVHRQGRPCPCHLATTDD